MFNIAGINLPKDKKILFALRYIYGIGPYISNQICKASSIDIDKRVKDLNQDEWNIITEQVEKYKIENELRSEVANNKNHLISLRCYRGLRHKNNLPVRGQRTHSNAETRRKSKKS